MTMVTAGRLPPSLSIRNCARWKRRPDKQASRRCAAGLAVTGNLWVSLILALIRRDASGNPPGQEGGRAGKTRPHGTAACGRHFGVWAYCGGILLRPEGGCYRLARPFVAAQTQLSAWPVLSLACPREIGGGAPRPQQALHSHCLAWPFAGVNRRRAR